MNFLQNLYYRWLDNPYLHLDYYKLKYGRRSRKEIDKYMDEAWEKVWLIRSYDFENKTAVHEVGQKGCNEILSKYKDIPEDGYSDWEYGFWSGVLATLRWVRNEEEKDWLDT
jgi:hypothetical protein